MDITFENVEHCYMQKTPFESLALKNINLSISSGSFVAVIGHTGSGKSTLVQHLNGLLKPTSGKITIGQWLIEANKKNKQLKQLRKHVGMVFQYPEHQLFDETVEKDICFGPMNFGIPEREAKRRARALLETVGLPETILGRSPFDLSGGQMRRVAIASVLAVEPNILILDEPTAGLDPQGRQDIMKMFYHLHKEKEMTTILVTHSMEDAATFADEIIVMDKGSVFIKGAPSEVFKSADRLHSIGLDVPETVKFILKVEEQFGCKLPHDVFTVDQVAEEIDRLLMKKGT
ncbi:energy-coupling factor ABC transporter ATP-binding protein [Anaerobacillus sp. MEB173]|uniref:energy-coupling factor ABC transporter ATP-binding protein n=1 Tax=Anaerobacillus sp. MEB173 TaxID=3383345 RepID=UPI003F925D32